MPDGVPPHVESGLARTGGEGDVHAQARNGRQRVAAPDEGQRVSLPMGHAGGLQQTLHRLPRPVARDADALAARARTDHYIRGGKHRSGKPRTNGCRELEGPVREF